MKNQVDGVLSTKRSETLISYAKIQKDIHREKKKKDKER